MTRRDPPESLQRALAAWLEQELTRRSRLEGRGPDPEPGDLYALPCHAKVNPTWMVLDSNPDGSVRIAPGDDRPWANVRDLWVGDHELCLRLEHTVKLPGSLLPADQRIGALPDAPKQVFEHEQALRFSRPDLREEDADQLAWRNALTRTARMLRSFLQEGTVELRLSEFRREDGTGPVGLADRGRLGGESAASMAPRLAASSSGPMWAFLQAGEALDGALLVDELDCECDGTLQIVASRRGLALLFRPAKPGAVPPSVQVTSPEGPQPQWQASPGGHAGASRIFFAHPWWAGPISLRIGLRNPFSLRVVDDGPRWT